MNDEKTQTSANTEIVVKIFAEKLIENANQAYEIFLFDDVKMNINNQKFVAQVYIELISYIATLESCTYIEAIERFEEFSQHEI